LEGKYIDSEAENNTTRRAVPSPMQSCKNNYRVRNRKIDISLILQKYIGIFFLVFLSVFKNLKKRQSHPRTANTHPIPPKLGSK
jgi:hypothetical protein